MAKYAVSQEGVAALDKLYQDLTRNNNEIKGACDQLLKTTNSVGSSIGIFEEQLNTLVQQVRSAQEAGEEGILQLSNKVTALKNEMQNIIAKALS